MRGFILSLRNRLTGRTATAPEFDAPLAPEAPIAVIGDVHGRDDLLGQLLDQLADEAPEYKIVLVGDYVDRGEQSRAVIERLRARPDLICLKGNHEAMCLAFLDDPEKHGTRWLRNGGLQTLASFGVGLSGQGTDVERMTAARDAFVEALGAEGRAWMAALPLQWRSGNIVVVHAAADPAQPLQLQAERTLLWGHPDFENRVREDGIWIAHGHVIHDRPVADQGRIATDTGAYASGRLTAALIAPGELRFVQTGAVR
ncbi:metallophosphoesterase (plasmid) [Limimaricola variabilis]|uniref:metallophosphoesterase n=1 Tax=Limimaricola variabilis TaxID=1492771 RepID=UPI002AC8DA6D|nr:metallophosphoesterase [Limimaricola variabilis]WPY96175.1 metallophosphoesterase [Limimaricola variabilis]